MGVFENIGKGDLNTALIWLGVAVVAPAVLPAVASGLRPLVKALVKGGVAVYDVAREGIAEAGDEINDLVSESRTEMTASRGGARNANTEGDEAGQDEMAVTTRSRRRRTR